MTKRIRPIARTKNIVVQKLEDETLLYDLESDKAFCLNDTSARIWHLCDGTKTAQDISDEISVELRWLVSEEVVWLAIDQFQKDGLIDELNASFFDGTSRREVIRKIGLKAEQAMFKKTKKVNAYKGLIFNLGIHQGFPVLIFRASQSY